MVLGLEPSCDSRCLQFLLVSFNPFRLLSLSVCVLCVCAVCVHIVQVNVTNLNYVSQADHQAPIIPTVIVFVAFSDRGQWMATVRSDRMCTPLS